MKSGPSIPYHNILGHTGFGPHLKEEEMRMLLNSFDGGHDDMVDTGVDYVEGHSGGAGHVKAHLDPAVRANSPAESDEESNYSSVGNV